MHCKVTTHKIRRLQIGRTAPLQYTVMYIVPNQYSAIVNLKHIVTQHVNNLMTICIEF